MSLLTRRVWHRADRAPSIESSPAGDAGRSGPPPLSTPVEDRAVLRLVVQLPPARRPLGLQGRELPRVPAARLHHHPLAPFMRLLLGRAPRQSALPTGAPKPAPARASVLVYEAADGHIEIRYRDRVMRWQELAPPRGPRGPTVAPGPVIPGAAATKAGRRMPSCGPTNGSPSGHSYFVKDGDISISR